MESAKNNLVDIYEKQIRFLRENKEELEIKNDSLTMQIKEKQVIFLILLYIDTFILLESI